ncbi:MAG: hypothetical protein ABIX01_15230 [Chitinophagaceae bacterium]
MTKQFMTGTKLAVLKNKHLQQPGSFMRALSLIVAVVQPSMDFFQKNALRGI